MPKVSIIIPTYNRAKYLSQSIESALSQDYHDIEVVVSDNASSDNTSETITKYLHDKRVKYFRNDLNIGMYPNQRKALYEYASGDWALMLDDDDYLLDKYYISSAMKMVSDNKDVVLIHANCRILYENSGQYKDTDKKLPEIVDGKWMFINYKYAIIGQNNYDKLTTLFNRKIALGLDFFHDIISSSDREGFLKISLKGKIAFIDKVVAVYRIHGSNAFATSSLNDYFDNIRAVINPYIYAKELKIFEEKKLESWKRRMIRESAARVFVESLIAGDVGFLKAFITRMYREYPFALTVILDIFKPKTSARLLFSLLKIRRAVL